ncbi:ribbon-helix-helix domain-containing protein [Clostridium algidicarnis]|uniref:Ribbon-helix-helix domain-containing protein n=1 Tax=Clostridium algidicarnis TaxID=37659 RepID=A0ABS6C526_9CLOT|nr:ribbon-helix-helix domain-containing protein [Clostridium algidicarnis]MBU3220568.1 ribbon-helix-helix domain-containing protein [Clostridium algidicarnis]MCB2286464.1 ribbon-helix-helix domain-containing protein [Clostridium algidicarnis]
MSNGTFKISEEILNQVKHLAEESGMSKEDFVHCLAKFYNVNDSSDCNCYYDSFTA